MAPKKKSQKKAQEVPEDSKVLIVDGGSGSQGGSQNERNVVETQRETSKGLTDSETENLRRRLLSGKRKRTTQSTEGEDAEEENESEEEKGREKEREERRREREKREKEREKQMEREEDLRLRIEAA